MARSTRKLTADEKNRLNELRTQYRYTKEDVMFMVNLHSEYIDNIEICFTCSTGKLQQMKNALYGWYEAYKIAEVKEQQELEHKSIVEANQAKLAEVSRTDKLAQAKTDIESYRKAGRPAKKDKEE